MSGRAIFRHRSRRHERAERLSGQGMNVRRALSHAAHFLVDVSVSAIGMFGACACALAWRLSQGPIDITGLARREQGLLVGHGASLAIGSAALAWEGFAARDQPLDIRVTNVAVTTADGARASVGHGRVTLALGQLLLGRLVPRVIDIDGAVVSLVRATDGKLDVDLGGPSPAGSSGGAVLPLLRALTAPARGGDGLPWVSQLQRLNLRDSRAELRDAGSGLTLRAAQANADLQRQPGGGVSGSARIDLSAGQAQATLTAVLALEAGGTHVTAQSTALSPAAVARLDPRLVALATVDAPLSMALDARFGPDLAPLSAALDLSLGAGRVAAGKGAVAIDSATLHLALDAEALTVSNLQVAFAAPQGAHAPPPVLTGQARFTRAGDRLHGGFEIGIAALDLADLAAYWPPGAGGGSRAWMVENVPEGLAHDARVYGTLESAPGFSDVALTSLTGGFVADDLTLFWLKPVPPIEHGRARVVIEGPDALHVDIQGGLQRVGDTTPLHLTGGSVRITGLSSKDQFGQIEADFAGPLADTMTLLDHPRLKLLSRRPIDVTDPSGDVSAHLSVHLPLTVFVTLDDIAIKARAALINVHLGHVALGRDLDGATLALAVDDDGLTVTGNGRFDAIDTDLTLDEDFRNGPPSQVLEHVTAQGSPDAAQLEKSGFPGGIVTGGKAALTVDYSARRDRTDMVSVSADLADAVLATPFGWSKAAGVAASAGAEVTLRDGRLAGLDHVRAEGPGLHLASHVEVEGGVLRALVLDAAQIGRTEAHGRIGLPTAGSHLLSVTLAGPRLDLSAYLDEKPAKAEKAPPPQEPPKPGLPWNADLHFDRVDLAEQKSLSPLSLTASDDGLRIASAQLDAGTPRAVTASIRPGATGRTLRLDATDAGSLLAGAGTFDNIHGGRLSLLATRADAPADAALAGTATLTDFTIFEAPAIGRLMQAMTLYGLADALRGPGLHFARMVAPFRWQDGVLTLAGARAFSPSLGLTARGTIDLRGHEADVSGTVVPAYFFNQLLGDLPLVGRVFSPEKGGGVFAARYSVRGKLADPKIGINPFSALTPGFLREIFDTGAVKKP
jgi:hypothetical protein